MGQQDGIIKLTGQVGDLTFYKTKNGDYQARRKGGVSAQRIKEDPSYARTRENMEEFGRAGKASKLVRNALRTVLTNLGDGASGNRLTRDIIKVLQSDSSSVRGKRTVSKGALAFLTGFEFNIASPFDTTFLAQYASVIDRAAGSLEVNFQPFTPANDVLAPQGSTHFRLITVGAAIDFEAGTHQSVMAQSETLELTPAELSVQPLRVMLAPGNAAMILVLGIEFYQFVNGNMYPLKSGAFNALTLVKVDQVQP